MQFIGTKIITAEPMTRAAYVAFRGWQLPTNESGADEGYLVEYEPDGKPNVQGRAGYVSWTPKAAFDNAYRRYNAMTFGLALEALKRGARVARAGWNGKGMFAYLVPANSYPAQTGAAKEFFGEGGMVPYNAYLALKGADDTVSTWAPSGSDALAEDWLIVEAGAPTTPLPYEIGAALQRVASEAPGIAQRLISERQASAAGQQEQLRTQLGAAFPGYSTMQPHQQRVVDEKCELDSRLAKLTPFFDTPIFAGLGEEEKQRLERQEEAMKTYSAILTERIAAFQATASTTV